MFENSFFGVWSLMMTMIMMIVGTLILEKYVPLLVFDQNEKGKIQWILIWHKSEQVQPHCSSSSNSTNFLHTSVLLYLPSINYALTEHMLHNMKSLLKKTDILDIYFVTRTVITERIYISWLSAIMLVKSKTTQYL